MMKREFLMLAHTYDSLKHSVAGRFVSTKLDGQRCFWDGGVSRGMDKRLVPWANQLKDQLKGRGEKICTGLWSRYGNVIHAPSWWIDRLPLGMFLDGELWLGRGMFEECRSIVSRHVPDSRWEKVTFNVFDIPGVREVFKEGEINNPNFKKYIDTGACVNFCKGVSDRIGTFEERYGRIFELGGGLGDGLGDGNSPVVGLLQTRLDYSESRAREQLDIMLEEETERGGEGLMLRTGGSYWTPKRMGELLKVKKFDDGECVVTGWQPGLGKLAGLVGAYNVRWGGIDFELSGFTDAEREIGHFPVGTVLRFRYRGLTNSGIPREARYWR